MFIIINTVIIYHRVLDRVRFRYHTVEKNHAHPNSYVFLDGDILGPPKNRTTAHKIPRNCNWVIDMAFWAAANQSEAGPGLPVAVAAC